MVIMIAFTWQLQNMWKNTQGHLITIPLLLLPQTPDPASMGLAMFSENGLFSIALAVAKEYKRWRRLSVVLMIELGWVKRVSFFIFNIIKEEMGKDNVPL